MGVVLLRMEEFKTLSRNCQHYYIQYFLLIAHLHASSNRREEGIIPEKALRYESGRGGFSW